MFKFELAVAVQIACSHEEGTVIARAQYTTSEPQYLIRYRAADGSAVEQWWAEDALTNTIIQN